MAETQGKLAADINALDDRRRQHLDEMLKPFQAAIEAADKVP